MKIEIRTAQMADLQVIAEVERLCFPAAEAASEESFRARLEQFASHFWLLCIEGQPVAVVNGMVTDLPDLTDEMFHDASMHHPDGAWQMIFGVATLPEHQRRGYAGQLLEYVIGQAREQGRAGLVLTCKEKLLHYYAKFGFINEGVSSSEHGGALWYQMRLTF